MYTLYTAGFFTEIFPDLTAISCLSSSCFSILVPDPMTRTVTLIPSFNVDTAMGCHGAVLRRERDRLETAVVAFHNPDVVCCLRPDRHSLLSAKMSACESLLSPNNGNFRPKYQILSDHRSIVACKIRAHTGKYPFYTMSVLFLFSTPLP